LGQGRRAWFQGHSELSKTLIRSVGLRVGGGKSPQRGELVDVYQRCHGRKAGGRSKGRGKAKTQVGERYCTGTRRSQKQGRSMFAKKSRVGKKESLVGKETGWEGGKFQGGLKGVRMGKAPAGRAARISNRGEYRKRGWLKRSRGPAEKGGG